MKKNKRNRPRDCYYAKTISLSNLHGLELLSNKIVLQAIRDWQSLDSGCVQTAQKNYYELERFFRSDWCDVLLHIERAGFNGRDILKWLKAGGEMNYDCNRK